MQRVQREEQGDPARNPELPSARKLERSAESLIEKEPDLKIDLRIEGIAQDVIFEDEERMGKPKEAVEKLRNDSRTKSILEDLGKPENSMQFSEESSRATHELGNIELHELGQISRTVRAIPA